VPGDGSAPPAELAQNPGVRMFCDRARALRADFAVTDERLLDIAAMVRTLDGLPLAIEIAAAHSDVLSTGTLRQRIADHADAGASATSGRTSGSRSLAAAIDASVVLLTEPERELLWALSVFPGTFSVEAAAAVVGREEDEVLVLLASLVRQSLVVLEERYRLLAPVRAHAARRAEAEVDVESLREGHARWVASVGAAVRHRSEGLRRRRELDTLRPLVPDARAALGWALERQRLEPAATIAVAFSWVWTIHGLAAEGLDWLLRVKDLSDGTDHTEPAAALARATVLRSVGLLANPVGRLQLAREACEEAIGLSEAIGDVDGAAAAGLTLAVSTWALGDVSASARSADRVSTVMADRPDSWTYVAARVLRARAALDLGEPGTEELLEEATSLAQSADEPHVLGLALACRARQSSRDGDVAAAAVAGTEALRVWRRIDYREGEVLALNLLARTCASADVEAAAAHAREALEVARAAQLRGGMCDSLESHALVAAASGRREHAAFLLAVSARERRRLATPLPPADAGAVVALTEELGSALGQAGALVEARAKVTRFDDLVHELLR
jgi:tetratricopeptide (TPR) repeat protein